MNTEKDLAAAEGFGRGAAMVGSREVRDNAMWSMGYKIGRSENRFGTLMFGVALGFVVALATPWAAVARVVAGFLS